MNLVTFITVLLCKLAINDNIIIQVNSERFSNKMAGFWQEFKRRKAVRVITVYAAAAFVIFELIDIVFPWLRLPEWTMNFIIVLLCVGFIITVIFLLVYDVTPGGIEKKDKPVSSNSRKIANYISFVVIVVLIVLNAPKSALKQKRPPSIGRSVMGSGR